MAKDDGAFLTIGELAQQLGVAQHILRYWETRFPQLRPLQRSGNRRYYRPRDVEVARHIHRLLNEEGFTVRGAQRVLAGRKDMSIDQSAEDGSPPAPAAVDAMTLAPEPGDQPEAHMADPAQDLSAANVAASPQGVLPIGDLPETRAAPRPERKEVAPSDLALLIARLTVIRQNLVDALEPE